MSKNKPGSVIQKLITFFSIITSILLVSFSIYVNHLIKSSILKANNFIKENTIAQNENLIKSLMNSTLFENIDIKNISQSLDKNILKNNEIYAIYIYKSTVNDDFFKLKDKIFYNDTFNNLLGKNKIVKINGIKNYLKLAKFETISDPVIYNKDSFYWFNVYSPYRQIENKRSNYILQFLISDRNVYLKTKNNINDLIKTKYTIIISLSISLALLLVFISIFGYKLSTIFRNLTLLVKRAKSGKIDLEINKNADKEIYEFAENFNSLLKELKDLREKDTDNKGNFSEDNKQKTVKFTTLFKIGVNKLKENKIQDGIYIFETLLNINNQSFGCFFNLGVAYAKLKNFEKSIYNFENALLIEPNNQTIKSYLAKVTELHQKYE